MIIIYIAKFIENYYKNKNISELINKYKDKHYTYKLNKSKLVNGIFDFLLNKLIYSSYEELNLTIFCDIYVNIIQNKKNRTFPRNSHKPFGKWYVKGYSNETKYMKIINHILEGKVDELNKNLKTIAKRIIKIDGEAV